MFESPVMSFLPESTQPIPNNVFVRNYPELLSKNRCKKPKGVKNKTLGQ